jgi:hypothetical protein
MWEVGDRKSLPFGVEMEIRQLGHGLRVWYMESGRVESWRYQIQDPADSLEEAGARAGSR